MSAVLLLAGLLAADSDLLVGEWAPDYELCKLSRVVYMADGQTMAIAHEEGLWEPLGSGSYQRTDDRLTEQVAGESQDLIIAYLDEHRLLLRLANPDAALLDGVTEAEFVRCPSRSEPES